MDSDTNHVKPYSFDPAAHPPGTPGYVLVALDQADGPVASWADAQRWAALALDFRAETVEGAWTELDGLPPRLWPHSYNCTLAAAYAWRLGELAALWGAGLSPVVGSLARTGAAELTGCTEVSAALAAVWVPEEFYRTPMPLEVGGRLARLAAVLCAWSRLFCGPSQLHPWLRAIAMDSVGNALEPVVGALLDQITTLSSTASMLASMGDKFAATIARIAHEIVELTQASQLEPALALKVAALDRPTLQSAWEAHVDEAAATTPEDRAGVALLIVAASKGWGTDLPHPRTFSAALEDCRAAATRLASETPKEALARAQRALGYDPGRMTNWRAVRKSRTHKQKVKNTRQR